MQQKIQQKLVYCVCETKSSKKSYTEVHKHVHTKLSKNGLIKV